MNEELKPADLLNIWREAVRAAELAERLASNAAEAYAAAGTRAEASTELAELAQQAADAAARAAERAGTAAARAAELAKQLEVSDVPAAERTVDAANSIEADARAAYHDATDKAYEERDTSDGTI
jgi:hypothetical protein